MKTSAGRFDTDRPWEPLLRLRYATNVYKDVDGLDVCPAIGPKIEIVSGQRNVERRKCERESVKAERDRNDWAKTSGRTMISSVLGAQLTVTERGQRIKPDG